MAQWRLSMESKTVKVTITISRRVSIVSIILFWFYPFPFFLFEIFNSTVWKYRRERGWWCCPIFPASSVMVESGRHWMHDLETDLIKVLIKRLLCPYLSFPMGWLVPFEFIYIYWLILADQNHRDIGREHVTSDVIIRTRCGNSFLFLVLSSSFNDEGSWPVDRRQSP